MQTEHATPLPPLTTAHKQAAHATGDVDLLTLAGQALIKAGQQVSAEMLAFWQSRLKDAVATGRRLLDCASPQEAWEIQMEYAQAALQAYVDQSTKVASLVTHSLLPEAPGAAQSRPTTTALAA